MKHIKKEIDREKDRECVCEKESGKEEKGRYIHKEKKESEKEIESE